jgi:hypothetical protein
MSNGSIRSRTIPGGSGDSSTVVPDQQVDGMAALDEEGQPASRAHLVGVAEAGEAWGIGHGGHGRGDNSSEIASAKTEAG